MEFIVSYCVSSICSNQMEIIIMTLSVKKIVLALLSDFRMSHLCEITDFEKLQVPVATV